MRYNKEQIGKWILEWEQSGKSVSAYCEEKPFEESTFYYWRRKKKEEVGSNKEGKFVSVQVSPSYIPQMSIHCPNGIRIDLHMMLSIEEIRTLTGC